MASEESSRSRAGSLATGSPDPNRPRAGSNRDKSKPLPNLGPDSPQRARPPVPQGTAHYLVVCGATKHEDGFIFSDFMGYCSILQERGINGTFLSCFPLRQHWSWLETYKPGVNDIKFGRISLRDPKGVIVYTKEQWQNGTKWWRQVPEDEIKTECLDWINARISEVKSGDVVNVILEGHGNQGRGLKLGDSFLAPREVSEIIAKFPLGVQVNVICGQCHSGQIVDAISASGQSERHIAAACCAGEVATAYKRSISNRIRNSRFSQAFCQSLARLKLPDVDQQPVIALGAHEEWMRVQTRRAIDPNDKAARPSDTYTFYNEPNDLSKLAEAMVFREKVDVVYDPATVASRRRIEYPSINTSIMNQFRHWGPDRPMPFGPVIKEAEDVIEMEAMKCDKEAPIGDDFGIFEVLFHSPTRNVPEMVKTLYWRGRIQMAILDTFTVLCNRGFLDPNCLRLPMNFYDVSKPVGELSWLLRCYEGPSREEKLHPKPFEFHGDDFNGPFHWLAAMILRGCSHIGQLFETITLSEFLGKLDDKAFNNWNQFSQIKHFQINGQEMADTSVGYGQFGFWLPHGLGDADDEEFGRLLREHVNRFNEIERVFREYFQIPQDEIYLEREQQAFFDRSPQKLPGWKRSGDWTAAFNMQGVPTGDLTPTSLPSLGSASSPPGGVVSPPYTIPSSPPQGVPPKKGFE